ncbi:unnamed protein product [Lepidochelys olivacea]
MGFCAGLPVRSSLQDQVCKEPHPNARIHYVSPCYKGTFTSSPGWERGRVSSLSFPQPVGLPKECSESPSAGSRVGRRSGVSGPARFVHSAFLLILISFIADDVENAGQSLDKNGVDLLMKYIYQGR